MIRYPRSTNESDETKNHFGETLLEGQSSMAGWNRPFDQKNSNLLQHSRFVFPEAFIWERSVQRSVTLLSLGFAIEPVASFPL